MRAMQANANIVRSMGALLLIVLQLLGNGLPAAEAECPTVTRHTIYGDQQLVCSGRGACSADHTRCECEDGSQTAGKRHPGWRDMWWQVEPGNIRANSGDCGGTLHAAATPQQITRHYRLLVLTYAALCLVCGWLFAPRLPCCARLPQPPRSNLRAKPSRLPVAAAISGIGTLIATVFGALFA